MSTKLSKNVFERRRAQFLKAILIGVLAGLAAVVFGFAISTVRSVLTTFDLTTVWGCVGLLIFCPGLGFAAGLITESFAPEASGSGIPHVKAVLLNLKDLRPLRLLAVKCVGGALVLGAGFSLGREGPTVHIGSTCGAFVAKWLKSSRRTYAQMVALGAGAGLAAAFNAPLAGFIFVIEELRREFSAVAYIGVLVAAVAADGISRAFLGTKAVFPLAFDSLPPLVATPWIMLISVIVAITGVGFSRSLLGSLSFLERKIPLRTAHRALIAGILVAVSAIVFPPMIAEPHTILENLFSPASGLEWSCVAIGLFFVAKFLMTVTCYISGVPGGIFAPMLLQGAAAGIFLGQVLTLMGAPFMISPPIAGMVGMVAFLSSVVRAPLTCVVLISEVTGNFALLFPFLIASVCAFLVGEWKGTPPIYEALLDRSLSHLTESGAERAYETIQLDLEIEAYAPAIGKKIRDLVVPAGILIATVRRGATKFVPNGETVLAAGDELAVIINPNATSKTPELRALFSAA